jgi:hypothetical protein
MQNATFYKLVWKKGTVAHVEEFEPHEKRPPHSSYIGENMYIVPGTPTRLYLTVTGEDGKQYTNDIYHPLLKMLNRKIMSEKLYKTLYQKFEKGNFTINKGYYISWESNLN